MKYKQRHIGSSKQNSLQAREIKTTRPGITNKQSGKRRQYL